MTGASLIFASLRLPITVQDREEGLVLVPSVGGLATGLGPVHARGDARWVGWTGLASPLSEARAALLDTALAARRLHAVALDGDEGAVFHRGYANRVLWPVLHGQVGRMPLVVEGFAAYEAVNRRVADACAAAAAPNATVWVHDYQLMLVPALLRAMRPDLRIGFFLHIPFAAPEAFAVLPQRMQLLDGLLGADLIGLHTHRDVRNLIDATRLLRDVRQDGEGLLIDGRRIAVTAAPMGIDVSRFRDAPPAPSSFDPAQGALLLGIDRLDYTKGLLRRFLAFEQLLADSPALHGHVHLLQLAVPSREEVGMYRRFRAEVEELVGRINGRFGTTTWTPVRYLHRALPFEELVSLYRAADVMLVTPLRDGLNLVAKEYVASRTDGDGVLVLSEFAGVADELPDALRVNPYDVAGMAQAYRLALTMPVRERRRRMSQMQARVQAADGAAWAADFLSMLQTCQALPAPAVPTPGSPSASADLVHRARRARGLRLFLDYDGTLVPLARTPEAAAPDADLLRQLRRLASRPRIEVHLVSGRPRAVLDAWFGTLPIGLHAEHGLWSRRGPNGVWVARAELSPGWLARADAIVRRFVERTPGSRLEEKSAGLAWHYREVAPDAALAQAAELHLHLDHALVGAGISVLRGAKVLEVRHAGVHKGMAAAAVAADAPPDTLLVACGDDCTDEDMFRTVEAAGGITVSVDGRIRPGMIALPDPAALRALLDTLEGSWM